MKLVYLAHPLSAETREGILLNIHTAKLWYKWACDNYWPTHAFSATWILNAEIYDDANAEDRDRGMQRNYPQIQRCDELWLVGSFVSSGMQGDGLYARRCLQPVFDLTNENAKPHNAPRFPPEDMQLWKPGSLTEQVAR